MEKTCEIKLLVASSGRAPFDDWYDSIYDQRSRRQIAAAVRRLENVELINMGKKKTSSVRSSSGRDTKMRLKPFSESSIAKDLRDPEFAAGYLEDALNENAKSFLIALRNVADANGGLGKVAELSELSRESLYKSLALSGRSKPYFSTIYQILSSLGLVLLIQPKHGTKSAA